MFRNIFSMLAALIVTTGAGSAAADVPISQRIANAQIKISELGSLAAPSEASSETKSKGKGQQPAQHWHDWNNWGNHHHHHHNGKGPKLIEEKPWGFSCPPRCERK